MEGRVKVSNNFGGELRRLRKQRGLTLNEVSELSGITTQYMSMLEKGVRKSVSFEIMSRISKFYGVPLDYFTKFLSEEEEVEALNDIELSLWNTLNQKIQDDIYYKKGDLMQDLIAYFLKKLY
jgi:transcriptional regulator with XRE-family HTH domain